MKEEEILSLQELKYAIENVGSFDLGDFNYDSLKIVLDFIEEQENKITSKNKEIQLLKEMHNKLVKEIEEKQTIIYAGAEKATLLEKEIEELKVINNMQKYRIEVIDERELIPKSKIKDKIEEYQTKKTNGFWFEVPVSVEGFCEEMIEELQELLESE